MDTHDGRFSVLRAIFAFSVVTTGLHYTHNFIEVEHYPQSDLIPNGVTQAGILAAWPLLTLGALLALRFYRRGSYRRAHQLLVAYSFLGFATLGHFAVGNPDLPAFWYATLFTDAFAGLAMLAFVAHSARRPSALAR